MEEYPTTIKSSRDNVEEVVRALWDVLPISQKFPLAVAHSHSSSLPLRFLLFLTGRLGDADLRLLRGSDVDSSSSDNSIGARNTSLYLTSDLRRRPLDQSTKLHTFSFTLSVRLMLEEVELMINEVVFAANLKHITTTEFDVIVAIDWLVTNHALII
ncbi:hypothetical protein LXL04_023221 [Taraxacum kok-saghyz]